jgi:hypothetical protein
MKAFIGVVEIGIGFYTLVRYKQVAASGSRFHQRGAKRLPWLYWVPGSKDAAGSERLWRVLAPGIGVFLIALGIFFLLDPAN